MFLLLLLLCFELGGLSYKVKAFIPFRYRLLPAKSDEHENNASCTTWKDEFSLFYLRTTRSSLSRAVNHPFKGREGNRTLNIIYVLLIEIKYKIQSPVSCHARV